MPGRSRTYVGNRVVPFLFRHDEACPRRAMTDQLDEPTPLAARRERPNLAAIMQLLAPRASHDSIDR